jgi:excisionase family DNA binding protein
MAKLLSPRLQIHQQITPCLLSITEAAVYIGGTNSLVVHLMREGKLESIKVGKSRRIDRHVLDAWIEADRRR